MEFSPVIEICVNLTREKPKMPSQLGTYPNKKFARVSHAFYSAISWWLAYNDVRMCKTIGLFL
jgi:hypothetical protein